MIETTKYRRAPICVEAVQVDSTNLEAVAEWCTGEIMFINPDTKWEQPYIKVAVKRPLNPRQTQARIGDWVLKGDRGFRVYNDKSFKDHFVLDEPEAESEWITLGQEPAVE